MKSELLKSEQWLMGSRAVGLVGHSEEGWVTLKDGSLPDDFNGMTGFISEKHLSVLSAEGTGMRGECDTEAR